MMRTPGIAGAPVLRDIHLPPAPSWWPPAPGWWILAAAILILALVAGVLVRRGWRMARMRRRILAEVDACSRQHPDDEDAARLANGLHQLLRRVARTHDPAATRLQGGGWRALLARVPVDAPTMAQLMTLEAAMYQPGAPFDRARATAAVRTWVRIALRPRRWRRTEVPRG